MGGVLHTSSVRRPPPVLQSRSLPVVGAGRTKNPAYWAAAAPVNRKRAAANPPPLPSAPPPFGDALWRVSHGRCPSHRVSAATNPAPGTQPKAPFSLHHPSQSSLRGLWHRRACLYSPRVVWEVATSVGVSDGDATGMATAPSRLR